MSRLRSTLFALPVLSLATAAYAEPPPVLSCIAPEKLGCGCHIRLHRLSCAGQSFDTRPQLFTELEEKAPLLLVLDGKETAVPHVSHVGTSLKGNPPGKSADVYRKGELEVELRYRPAKSTCPPGRAEGCEFIDVNVEVTLSRPHAKKWFASGTGACGC